MVTIGTMLVYVICAELWDSAHTQVRSAANEVANSEAQNDFVFIRLQAFLPACDHYARLLNFFC